MVQATGYVFKSRHNVYYFRLRIPKDIQHLSSQTHIRRSLKTHNRREAFLCAAQWLDRCESLFEYARSTGILDILMLQNNQKAGHYVQPKVEQAALVTDTKPLLTEVVEELSMLSEKDGITLSVIDGKKALVRLMVEIIGDKPIDEYSRTMCRKFREIALKLPPKNRGNSHLSVRQLLKSSNGKTISTVTFNNYVKDLSSVFNYGIREGYCSSNPFAGLKLKVSDKPSIARQKYDSVELSTLFSSQIFRSGGCGEQAYKYWLPLLALYTGARLNELCQLHLCDIVRSQGLWSINFNDSHPEQRLKNSESRRIVPLHPKLLDLGFIEFVFSLKGGGRKRLFPELNYQLKRGYSARPSKWFARYKLEQLGGLNGQKKDFHSFRHTVADSLKQEGVSEPVAAAILGHKCGGITYNRYGKDFPPSRLYEAVKTIGWPLEGVARYQVN